MKKSLLFVILAAAFLSTVFSACTSLGDISIDSQKDKLDKNLAKIEEAIVPLEAIGAGMRTHQTEITQARQLLAGLENERTADAEYSGKLTAWSGRLAILEGRYSEAQRLYRQSTAASSGNIPSIVLGIRLEGNSAKRLEIVEKELLVAGIHAIGVGELNIERARVLIELNRFSEAAGAFDIAFGSRLNPVYRESYGAYRTRAWELRNASGVAAGTFGFLVQESISWNDIINIVKNETQLLRFLTGGRTMSDADLYNRLLDRAFIPYTQDVAVTNWPMTKPKADEVVTRAGAAFFVWHLFAESRADRGLLSRYSARHATGPNPRSPITDVPVLSPFFDSILGSVEWEFLSLPDGRNFRPAQPIRGAELLAILKKIDN